MKEINDNGNSSNNKNSHTSNSNSDASELPLVYRRYTLFMWMVVRMTRVQKSKPTSYQPYTYLETAANP